MGHIHDDEVGDVLIIRRHDLPTETPETAAAFLRSQRIPGVLPSTITKARKNGELSATVIAGHSVLYSRSDLLAWVHSRHGNSEQHFEPLRKGLQGNKNAWRK
jgi:hypothetical protein